MRALLLIAVLCLPGRLFSERVPAQLKMIHITSSQGLPGNTIRAIEQDDDGFLWMAGTNGLARFDGYRFVPFNDFGPQGQNALPHHIGKLYLDRRHHTLWLGTSTYTHACLDLNSGHFVDFTGRHDTERPYRKALAVADGVWLSSNTLGLRHVIQQGSRFHIVDYTTKNHRLLSDRVLTIEEDVRHNIWAATEKDSYASTNADTHAFYCHKPISWAATPMANGCSPSAKSTRLPISSTSADTCSATLHCRKALDTSGP